MRNLVCVLLVMVLGGCGAHETNEPHSVRLRFTPNDTSLPAAGSASWTGLGGSPSGAAFIRTPLGGEFSLMGKSGLVHFKATLVAGDDDHLVLELQPENGSQRIEVQRDKAIAVRIKESKYEFSYPSRYVSSADIPTKENAYAPVGPDGQTNMATLFVKHLP